jgi:hypothetical protein
MPRSKKRVGRPHRSSRTITATVAARRFSAIVNRVCFHGETFVVERAGSAVCEIGPAKAGRFSLGELDDLLRSLPPVDADYWQAVRDAAKRQPSMPGDPWER